MTAPLIYLLLCVISGYAIGRLGQVCDKLEARQIASMSFGGEPPGTFLKDFGAACVLSLLFLVAIICAFTLDA